MQRTGNSPRIFRREDHANREDLTGEHPCGDSGQVVALILFLTLWAVDSFMLRFSTILSGHVPLAIRFVLAAFCFIAAGCLARSGLKVVFKEVRDPPQVINRGVFGLVRHPIYLSALLFYLGFIFTTLSIISIVFLGVIFFFYDYIAGFEERALEKRFGQDYVDYMNRVPKWFPRLRKRV